jgi:VanZ family protein
VNLKKLCPQALFFCALLSVTVLALLPTEFLSSPVFNWWDKAQHALAFTVLGILGFVAFPVRIRQLALGLVLYGVAIELAQLAVGWRFGEWEDVLADISGVMVAGLVRSLWRKWLGAA